MVGSHQIIIFTFSGNTRMVEAPDYHYQPPMRDLYIVPKKYQKDREKKSFGEVGNYILRPAPPSSIFTMGMYSPKW